MQQHDFDAPNLDTVRKPRGRSRLFLEDDPSMSVEDDPPTGVEYDASVSVMPSDTKRTSSASVVFAFCLCFWPVSAAHLFGGTMVIKQRT